MSAPKQIHGIAPVARFIAPLTREAFKGFGFTQSTIITDWGKIAGPYFSGCAVPVRLKQQAQSKGRMREQTEAGAVLVLHADPSRVLELHYALPQLIDRINSTLGYRAITAIQILQRPVKVHEAAKKAPQAGRTLLAAQWCDHTKLNLALSRLHQGVKGKALNHAALASA